MAAFKRFLRERAEREAERKKLFTTLDDSSSPSDWSSDDDLPPAAKRRRGPAVVRFLFEARDFPRLKSALVAAASAWVGPAGGVHVSVDDAHGGGDVDDDVVMTVRAADPDTALRAVAAVWRRYCGTRHWTADVLVDAGAVYRAWHADAAWRVRADRDPPGDAAVRVVRVRADVKETLRRVRRLMDMCDAEEAAAAAAEAAGVDAVTSLSDAPGRPPSCQPRGWSPSFPGARELNLSESSSSEDDSASSAASV